MKGDPCVKWRHRSKAGGPLWNNGQALIIVLAVIVLISALMVGFLIRASAGRIAAGSYSTTARTRELSDIAVNLMQAQINQAISYSDTNSYAWASQPGALRVFNNSGAVDSVYRLYSAPTLISTGSTAVSSLTNDIPQSSSWTNSPDLWVDLNAPAPVMGLTDSKNAQAIAYPILDIRSPVNASGTNNVEGFYLGSSIPGATALQPVPMPVQWLYVLQNGEIVPPDASSTSKKVTFTNASVQPSSSDPIVGRIACWTDDETCKINVNTAGADGTNNALANTTDNVALKTFWDTPHFISTEDNNYGYYQPARNEFQRYPGHPATTALKDILNSLGFTGINSTNFYGPPSGTTLNGVTYGITPRYAVGGSYGGTYGGTNTVVAISTRGDRLYPDVGEMLFNPDRTPSVLNNGTIQEMEPGKFFLTANSRAPEVNLFGQPRISMWPISSINDSNHRSATDQLLSFCSTVGTNAYYFTRTNPMSTTGDISIARNQTLLNFLDQETMASIPGYGGNFDSKYPYATLNGTSVSERRQILTEMFDYIRATNIHDSTVTNPFAAAGPGLSSTDFGEGQVVPSINSAWGTEGFGRAYKINEVSLLFVAMGSNTNSVVTAVDPRNPGGWDSIPTTGATADQPPANTVAIRAFLLFSIFDPGMGFTWIVPDFYVTVDGLQNAEVSSYLTAGQYRSLGFYGANGIVPIPIIGPNAQNFQNYTGGTAVGGLMDFRCITAGHYLTNMPWSGEPEGLRYPFYSEIVPVAYGTNTVYGANTNVTTMTFSGCTNTIYICSTNAPSGGWTTGVPPASAIIQKYTVAFPGAILPVPQINPSANVSGSASPPVIGGITGTVTNVISYDRWQTSTNWPPAGSSQWIAAGDVVRSMVLTSGDVRMLACTNVPASAFMTTPNYFNTNVFLEHGYSTSSGRDFLGMVRGTLDPAAVYNTNYPASQPFVPSQITNALTSSSAPGDWDNGVANTPDGPFIDRPDEGSAAYTNGANSYLNTTLNPNNGSSVLGPSLFSPNRQVSSPVMFGSLPTGVIHQYPWQTLLFRPGPGAAGYTPHPGEAGRMVDGTALAGAPPDHLLLDLFWMPVCEPYAISEPFSTAGKVNLNYQIQPFTYITRSTALRAVLDSEKIAALNTSSAVNYKTVSNGINSLRYPIDLNNTLAQCDSLFASGMIYRSASQICDLFLVPQQTTPYASWSAFATKWYQTGANAPYGLIGDNVRERPYAHLYSRLTTKSNTYSVHFAVQALKNASSDPTSWTESSGVILGEYRGTTTLERYINPNDSNLNLPANDFATYYGTTPGLTLDSFYKWRIVRNEQFGP